MICTCMYNSLDRLRNLCQVQNRIEESENFFLFISLRERFLTTGTSFILFYFVLPAFLDTGLPRGNSPRTGLIGSMQGAIPTQSQIP